MKAELAFDRAYQELTAAGVPSVQPPHDTGNSNRNAMLCDPDGNLVEIVPHLAQEHRR